MARDAIARQYDVDKNSVYLNIPRGTITFSAKKGKSIDLHQIRASLRATRLSGRTGMEVISLEITVLGDVGLAGAETRLNVGGTGQHLLLGDDPDARPGAGETTPFQRLRQAVARGEKVTRVTGRVHGWSGPFPRVLGAPAGDQWPLLIVREFQAVKSGR